MIRQNGKARKLVPFLFVAAMLTAAAGCSRNDAPETDKQLRVAATTVGKQVKDPWLAFLALEKQTTTILKAEAGHCETKFAFPKGEDCREIPAKKLVAKLKADYLKQAIMAGRVGAMAYLFSEPAPEDEFYVFAALRKEMVPNLLDLAKTTKGLPEDRPILMAAAKLIADGDETILNTEKAISYYAMAWAAGEAQAADSVARLFLSINDPRNAYLWSLRCTGSCQRGYAVALNQLQDQFTPEAAMQIQKLAATSSVIELDTGR